MGSDQGVRRRRPRAAQCRSRGLGGHRDEKPMAFELDRTDRTVLEQLHRFENADGS